MKLCNNQSKNTFWIEVNLTELTCFFSRQETPLYVKMHFVEAQVVLCGSSLHVANVLYGIPQMRRRDRPVGWKIMLLIDNKMVIFKRGRFFWRWDQIARSMNSVLSIHEIEHLPNLEIILKGKLRKQKLPTLQYQVFRISSSRFLSTSQLNFHRMNSQKIEESSFLLYFCSAKNSLSLWLQKKLPKCFFFN